MLRFESKTQNKNFTILSDQESSEILDLNFEIDLDILNPKACALWWNVSDKMFIFKFPKNWILFLNQVSKPD